MTKVRLIYAQKPHKGEKWTLAATKDGLSLSNEEGEEVTFVPNEDTPLRIKFPSFWASISFIVVLDDAGEFLCFEPKKDKIRAVKDLVAECQGQAGSAAVSRVRSTALRDLLVGGALFLLGGCLTVGSILLAEPGGYYIVTTGLLAGGAVGAIKGFYGFYKAEMIECSLPDEVEIVDGEEA